eukprot:4527027-Amphidinium_carterae.1
MSCGDCRWGLDPSWSGRALHMPRPVPTFGQPESNHVQDAFSFCRGGGCEYGCLYTTRDGRTLASTAHSWRQAGQAAWSSPAGAGQLGCWRGHRRREQDCREYSRFGHWRRGPRHCSRKTALAQASPHERTGIAWSWAAYEALPIQDTALGMTLPGQAGRVTCTYPSWPGTGEESFGSRWYSLLSLEDTVQGIAVFLYPADTPRRGRV